MYIEGKKIERYGSIYFVERVYEISDEYMKKYNLIHKKRVTLMKLSGKNGSDKEDFAISD